MEYTEQDVRTYYGDQVQKLNSEQIRTIANVWTAIDNFVTYHMVDMSDDQRISLTESLADLTAQIIDGSITIEEMDERFEQNKNNYQQISELYRQAQIIYLKEDLINKFVHLAQKALVDGFDLNELLLQDIAKNATEEIEQFLHIKDMLE